MNRLATLGVLLFTLLALNACHNNEEISKQKKEKKTETKDEKAVVEEPVFALIVSFYSPGNGIDHEMKTDYLNFVSTFDSTINYQTVKWGREGEVDLCFLLEELSDDRRDQFLKESRALLKKSERVHLYENSPAKH